jgi:hypothetical protein
MKESGKNGQASTFSYNKMVWDSASSQQEQFALFKAPDNLVF